MSKKVRNTCITIFVILWTAIFHYESTRYFYLQRLFKKPLPKIKLLFPPAGWIMFYNVDDKFGSVEVYSVKNKTKTRIDPHDIFRTRTIGYDNIHRGIMGKVSYEQNRPQFCSFLQRRFSYFDEFLVVYNHYPSVVKERYERYQKVLYRCIE